MVATRERSGRPGCPHRGGTACLVVHVVMQPAQAAAGSSITPGRPASRLVHAPVGLGVAMTVADLPNAFPYFIAIERLLVPRTPQRPHCSSWSATASSTAYRAWPSWLRGSLVVHASSMSYDASSTGSAPKQALT